MRSNVRVEMTEGRSSLVKAPTASAAAASIFNRITASDMAVVFLDAQSHIPFTVARKVIERGYISKTEDKFNAVVLLRRRNILIILILYSRRCSIIYHLSCESGVELGEER